MAEQPRPSLTSQFRDMLGELIRSKKFSAFVMGVVANLAVLVASKMGIPEEQAAAAALKVSGLVASYIVGQGMADMGKEAAKSLPKEGGA